MRILVLSANTGGGHNSAASAIMATFAERGVECVQRDALGFVSEHYSEVISNGHVYIYRYMPQLFGAGYRFEEKHPPKIIYDQMAWGAKNFSAYLSVNDFDAIICTHIFGSMLVTETRRKYGLTIPHYLVVTDYAVYPGSDMIDVRRYFIPSKSLTSAYEAVGISVDRISASGIPIHPTFLIQRDVQAVRKRLHLPLEGRIVLLFSGSIGCGRLHRVAPELERQLPEDTTLVIICGNNSRLQKQLKDVCSHKTIVVGYTTRVADYMAAADLCISKPGGLSITEMLVSQLPMVLMLSVPGCETRNQEFFVQHKAAVGTDEWEEAIHLTSELLRNPEQLAQMRRHLIDLGYEGGSAAIADIVISDIEEKV